MGLSETIQAAREAQRDDAGGLTPGDRLLMALELSDVCAQLNAAGAQALEERHAAGASEKEQCTP